MESLDIFFKSAQTLGVLIAGGALIVAEQNLAKQHKWNRKASALQLIKDWNSATQIYKRAIEEAFPEYIRGNNSENCLPITRLRAEQIYACKPTEKIDWEIRHNAICLLNALEIICVAWHYHIAEQKILEGSVKDTVIYWHDSLNEFNLAAYRQAGYPVWKPLDDIVKRWKAGEVQLEPEDPL